MSATNDDNVIDLSRRASLDTVRAVAKRYPVFPCRLKEETINGRAYSAKSPRTARGFYDATKKAAAIQAWWNGSPDSLVAVPTGSKTGIVAIDYDGSEGAKWYEAHRERLPPTQTHKTRRGGHLLFAYPLTEEVASRNNGVAPKVDVKADGGYVIWWPAHGYPVENEGVLAEVPDWLLELIREPDRASPADENDEFARLEGRTNHTIYDAVLLLDGLGTDLPYDSWLHIGMALHHQFGDEGLDLWNRWSAKDADRYKGVGDLQNRWKGFRRRANDAEPVTFRTILGLAKEATKPATPGTEIVFRHIADIVADKRQTEWLIRDILETNVLALIAGPRGTFKSFIALHWAMTAAIAGHGVVILSGEGAGLDRRIDAWHRTHIPDAVLSSLPMVALERVLNLTQREIVARLADAIIACQYTIQFVLIDTLSKYTPGIEESSNKEMAEFLFQLAVLIRDALKVTVLLVAHTGHTNQERPRGAYALMANTEAEYMVQRRDPTGMVVTVSRDRFKDTPSLPELGYIAEVVDLGRVDQDLRTVTSLILRETDAPSTNRKAIEPKGSQQKLVYKVIKDCIGPGGTAKESDVLNKAIKVIPKPDTGRDRRREHIKKILAGLIEDHWIARDGENLKVVR